MSLRLLKRGMRSGSLHVKSWIATAQSNPKTLEPFKTPQAQEKSRLDGSVWTLAHSLSTIPTALEIGFPLPKLSVDLEKQWPAGEEEALKRLSTFLQERGAEYQTARDIPSTKGTSRLSPYLAAGVISARTCVTEAKKMNSGRLDSGSQGLM